MRRNLNEKHAFIDANLLIYLNCMKDDDARRPYKTFYLDILKTYATFTDLLVIDELLWISRKKYGVPYDITLDFIRNAVLPPRGDTTDQLRFNRYVF